MKLFLFHEKIKDGLECNFVDGHIHLNNEKFPLPKKSKQIIRIIVNNKPLSILCGRRDKTLFLSFQGITEEFTFKTEQEVFREKASGLGGEDLSKLLSQIPGKIIKIFVTEGQSIKSGQPLLVMEAMKMENELVVKNDETIEKIHVKEGDTIDAKALLISFKEKK